MSDLPDPPIPFVPAEIDISKLDGFMLNTERLLGSDLVALSTGDEFKAAVLLWCRAWKQRPAASLPDNDKILASFAGLPLAKWKRVREVALRGFVKCSDGRLYHAVLAADALRAHKAAEQRRQAIAKRWSNNGGDTGHDTAVSPPKDARSSGPIPKTGRDEASKLAGDAAVSEERKAALEIIDAFDEIRVHVWGAEQKRPIPSPADMETAKRWLRDGAEFYPLRDLFETRMTAMQRRGDRPPGALKYFDRPVAEMLVGRAA